MTPKEIFDALVAVHGEAVNGFVEAVTDVANKAGGPRDAYCMVAPAEWGKVALTLRDDPRLRMDFLQCITAVDLIKQEKIQVVYHLYSYEHRHTFVVKADLPRANPALPSVVSVWRAADWQEREQFDLFGVGFEGHPELKRLLMPDDWIGHPMRKDYKEPAMYRGMPTTRPSPLDLLVSYDKEMLANKKKAEEPKA